MQEDAYFLNEDNLKTFRDLTSPYVRNYCSKSCFGSVAEQSDRGPRSVELLCKCSYDRKYCADTLLQYNH